MGNFITPKRKNCSTQAAVESSVVDFRSFTVLRSIGRGSYSKVCIAQKKGSKQLYAIKYVNKNRCIQEGGVMNVLQELKLLRIIEHPHIVNLRYAFHDFEDMCLVFDLLQGGDLNYHLTKGQRFSENDVVIYLLEIGSALEYLRHREIVHRDVKPGNLLLDLHGHLYLTDFNVASKLNDGRLSQSECGTWQYMAPEIFAVSSGTLSGYSYAVDWWSLGVTCYELVHFKRPFDLPKSATGANAIFATQSIQFSSKLSPGFLSTLEQLLDKDFNVRLNCCSMISTHLGVCLEDIESGKVKPNFLPSMKKLNVDPAYELEEMIIESKPIHKKESRMSKTASMDNTAIQKRESTGVLNSLIEREFVPFNYEDRSDETNADVQVSISEVNLAVATSSAYQQNELTN